MFDFLNVFLYEYPLTICLLAALVAVQVLFCYKVKHRWISMIPSLLIALLLIAVMIPYTGMLYGGVQVWFIPTMLLSFAVILPGQLFLCFKLRNIVLRLLPTVLLFLACIANLIIGLCISGWDGLFFIFLAIHIGFGLLVDGIAWGIWAMVGHIRKFA